MAVSTPQRHPSSSIVDDLKQNGLAQGIAEPKFGPLSECTNTTSGTSGAVSPVAREESASPTYCAAEMQQLRKLESSPVAQSENGCRYRAWAGEASGLAPVAIVPISEV